MSKIVWTDETWNPITGCSKISPGCLNCYAERMSKRLAGRFGYPADEPFRVTLHQDKLKKPTTWEKPRRIFVCSMGDIFHKDVPPVWLVLVFHRVIDCPWHTFMFLTKRPEIAYNHLTDNSMLVYYSNRHNFWLGVTIENQDYIWRLQKLLETPVGVRFVSVEPMLGPVILSNFGTGTQLNWVICGCESGPGARPMDIEWVRDLRDQCIDAGVPFFFKQMMIDGKLVELPELDGKVWDQIPEVHYA